MMMKPNTCSPGMRRENCPVANSHEPLCALLDYCYAHLLDEELEAQSLSGSRNSEVAEPGRRPRSARLQSPWAFHYNTASQEHYCPQRTLEQKQLLGLSWVIFNWYQVVKTFLKKSVIWFRRQNLKSKTASSVRGVFWNLQFREGQVRGTAKS